MRLTHTVTATELPNAQMGRNAISDLDITQETEDTRGLNVAAILLPERTVRKKKTLLNKRGVVLWRRAKLELETWQQNQC